MASTGHGLIFHEGGGAWDGQIPKKVEVIVIHAGFGDATMLQVTGDKGAKHHYLIDGGPTTMPGSTARVFFFANLIETFLKHAFKGSGTEDVFKAEGIMVTHSDADHKEGVQKLLDKFPPNQDPSPGKSKFEFDGPLLFNSSAIVRLGAIKFTQKLLSPGDKIPGFESIFTFLFPGAKGELYYDSTKLPATIPGPPPPPSTGAPYSFGSRIYHPDSSPSNKSSILLHVSDPNNTSDIQVSLNGDSVGYLALISLQGKNPNVFKVPHHGSRKNSIPLVSYEPNSKDETIRNLAALALLQFMQTPKPAVADLVVTHQITKKNIETFEGKFDDTFLVDSAGVKTTKVLRDGLKYDDVFLKLATEFESKVAASGFTVANLRATLQNRKDKIEDNLKDTSLDSKDVYTNGMASFPLPPTYNFDTIKAAVLKDADNRDKASIKSIGYIPPGALLPYKEKDTFNELFKYLITDRIFEGNVSLHLITSLYEKIQAKTYFISSGDQHKHPNWQVVTGIIRAAQTIRKTVPAYTCRLLLTSGNGIDEENLPDITPADDWTNYVSLQYFGGQTASVTIDPSANAMDVLTGAVQWTKGSVTPLTSHVLKDQYNKTAGALKLKKLRSAILGKKYFVKPSGHNLWLNFVVDPTTKEINFQLDATSAKLELTKTTVSEVDIRRKTELIFTLTMENSSKEEATVYGFIGTSVLQSGNVPYKLFQKELVLNAATGILSEERHYYTVSAGALDTTTDETVADYFVVQIPPPGSAAARVRRAAAPRSDDTVTVPFTSLDDYLATVSDPPSERTGNSLLKLLLGTPDEADVPQSLQTGFFPTFLNWNLNNASIVSNTFASLIIEIPDSENSIYSFVIRSAWMDVTIPEKRINLLIEVRDGSEFIFTLRLSNLRWTKDSSSEVLTLIKDTSAEDVTPTTGTTIVIPGVTTAHNLSEFLELIDYHGDSNMVSSQTLLNLIVATQVTSQLLTSGILTEESASHKFIKAMLSWNVNSSSSFRVTYGVLLSAVISLVQPSTSQPFGDLSISSTSITIKNPKTNNLTMELQLAATDSDGLSVKITMSLEQLIREFVQTFHDYLRAMGIKEDPSTYNFYDSVMFLLGSETAGFLSLASFTRALVSKVFQWGVNLTTSTVDFASLPLGPKVLEATLAALIPDSDDEKTVDFGISNVVKLNSLAFKVPNKYKFDQQTLRAPYLTADVTVGDKSARITAVTPQGDDLPSLKFELTQSISLNNIITFLGLDSSIANAQVPMLSDLLKNIQITSAGFSVQQKVLNSNQSYLSTVFFAVQFSNVSAYLPSAFTSLQNIQAQVVIYQPLLSFRKIAVSVTFNFEVAVQRSGDSTENVNLAAVLSSEPVQITSQADSSYNFSVAILISSNAVNPSEGLSLSAILTAFGLGDAVSSAKSIPFIKSLLQNVVLRELRITLNTASKSIQSFLLKVYIPSWKLFGDKVELSEFEIFLSYNSGDWATKFEGNAVFSEEYPITIWFDFVSGGNKLARFSFTNLNYEFTIQKFLSVFKLGSLAGIPVLDQVLSIAVTDAKLSLKKTDSGIIATEGEVSLYKESFNLGSIFRLSQVNVTIGFVHNEEHNNYSFRFSVEGFINQKVYLSVAYDPDTQELSGQALVASFQTAKLSEAVGAFLPSSTLSKNSVYTSMSDSFTAAIFVAFEWKSGDFRLKNLIVDLKNLFTIGPINLEQLRFEYSKTDTTTTTPPDDTSSKLLPAGSQIKVMGLLTGDPDKTFGAIVEFDLNKDTTGESTITASIRPIQENTLTLSSFLSLFSITPPDVPTIEGQDTPNFFDLALNEASIELSLRDYSLTNLHVKVETTNAVNLLDSPQITLENLSFEVNYFKKKRKSKTTGTLLGVITLPGIKVAIEGSKKSKGTTFIAVVGPESADLQEFIRTLTPTDSTPPTIPTDVGLPQPMPVSIASLIIDLMTTKKTINFEGVSQLRWNIDLGFTNFQILELGGIVNYTFKTQTSKTKFDAYVTGKFQFSTSILMEAELHFGVDIDTVLAVLVTDASQINVGSVANDLLKFNQSKTPVDSSTSAPASSGPPPSSSEPPPSSSGTPFGAIAFADLLPSSTSSLVNLTSAYMNVNLSQSVFLLLGQIASLGSGFLLAGKFSPQQTGYGYAFGISLPEGFRFSQLLSALAPIDDIVLVRKATCVVISMENAKVDDVVEKMKAAKNSTILPKKAKGFVFPFSDLELDDATKNLIITKGMSVYAEFDIPALGSDSIFHSIIQISNTPDIPAVILSAIIASDPTESEFRAHFAQIILLGLLEFNDVTMIYRPNSSVTLELHGTIGINLPMDDTSYSFHGLFTLTKTEAVFSVTSDPSKQVTIHEPLGMFGISLEDARLYLRYSFPEEGPKSSTMSIIASVNFYSLDSLNPSDVGGDNPQTSDPVLSTTAHVAFRDYSPIVVSVTLSPTKPLTIADLVATIFKWNYNLDFLNIGFVGGRIYFANLPEGENSITIDNVEYKSGYHISADTEIFDIVFTIAADIPLDKSQISITGYANQPIDLGFAKFTGKKDSDPSQPDENRSPQLTFTTSSSSTSISIGVGLILFNVPLATADIGYNLTRKVFTGTLTYSGSIGFIENPSISFEWSSESGFKVTGFPMSGNFGFDFLDKLRNYRDECGTLVDLAFKEAVQTKFNINTNFAKTTQPDDFLAEIQITGTYDVLLGGQAKIVSVPIPDLSVGIPREDDFSLNKLPQFILDLFTKNADRIVEQIISDPKRLGAILGIAALKTVSQKVANTLLCRNVETDDVDPEQTEEDFTDEDFDAAQEAETSFEESSTEFENLLNAGGNLGEAGAAAAGAEKSGESAVATYAGIVGAIAAVTAIFAFSSLDDKSTRANDKQIDIDDKVKNVRKNMEAALDIKQAPTTVFIPPNELDVSWNPLAQEGGSYHLVVTGMLLPPPGSETFGSVVIYDSVIPQTQQKITNEQLYNAVGITVTVNATVTGIVPATEDSEEYTFTYNGKSYTTEVANVHPTLHAPDQVSATYEYNDLRLVATASAVNHAKAYHFDLVEGTDVPYTVISQSVYTLPDEPATTNTISASFNRSDIPSTASGPFKVRCQAVAESGSSIAASAYTYSTSLSLVPPPEQLTLLLSHFGEPNQNITLNWSLPQSTDQDSLSSFLCRIAHKESTTVLVSYAVQTPASTEEDQPPPDIPTTHSFTIDSVVQALKSNNLIPDPPAPIELEAQVSAVGNSSAVIDSIFTTVALTSLQPPEQVDFQFSRITLLLTFAWRHTQETGTFGIKIMDETAEVVFSKSVTVNKGDAIPQDFPDPADQKISCNVHYDELSSINDPNVNYTVQITAVTTGNDELDSLVPGTAADYLHKHHPPKELLYKFNTKSNHVDFYIYMAPYRLTYGLLHRFYHNSTLMKSHYTGPSVGPSAEHTFQEAINYNYGMDMTSVFEQLEPGDQVQGTIQLISWGGNYLSSNVVTLSKLITVSQPPANITYSFSPTEETITITCSQVDTMSEYLLGLSNDTNSDEVSLKDTFSDNQISVTILISRLNQSDVMEWKVFARSLGDETHFPSPRKFLENTVHILPMPEVQQPTFDDNYDVLTVTWSQVANAVSYNLTVTAMKEEIEVFTTTKSISPPTDGQDVVGTISMRDSDPEWESNLHELTSLTGNVVAVGADYYISSHPSPIPAIRQFDPPDNLRCGYDDPTDRIRLSCDPAEGVSEHTLGLRHGDLSRAATVESEFIPIAFVPADELRIVDELRIPDPIEWTVFGESVGDSTHFRSSQTTLESNMIVLNPPSVDQLQYLYNDSNKSMTMILRWSSVPGASGYRITVTYRNLSGENNSFEVLAEPTATSIQFDVHRNVLDWRTVFLSVTSIVVSIKAIGSGYYVTSKASSYPPIGRLNTPANVAITLDSENVTITWATVSLSFRYNVVVKVNGRQVFSQLGVRENRLVVSRSSLPDSETYHIYRIRAEVAASGITSLPSMPGIAEETIVTRELQRSLQFGGEGGLPFDDPGSGIKALRIRHGNQINSIQVTFLQDDGSTYVGLKHGGNEGEETYIEFDEGEEIVKVFGTLREFVSQLAFVTRTANGIEKKYGPFGEKQETPFQVTGKILGVFGRSSGYLDAIGFYMIFTPIVILKSPQYRRPTHGSFTAFDDSITTHSPRVVNIRGIRVGHSRYYYRSIKTTYILEDGSTWTTGTHGQYVASETVTYVQFDAGEYIVRVDGREEDESISQLTFTTQKFDGTRAVYGPYGYDHPDKDTFSFIGHIIGFFGLRGTSIYNVGFYYTPLPPDMILGSQEFGGNGGTEFDDNITQHKPEVTGIREIKIRPVTNAIASIQATYRLADGSTWEAPKHGGTSDAREYTVDIGDDEYIRRIEGSTDGIVVKHLTFKTIGSSEGSQRSRGPYGTIGSRPFSIDGKILGFFGRAGQRWFGVSGGVLDSIGVYYLPQDT